MIIVPLTLYSFNASWFPSFVRIPQSIRRRCLCMQERSRQLASVLASLFSTPQPAIGLPDTGISNRKSDMSKCLEPDYPNCVKLCSHRERDCSLISHHGSLAALPSPGLNDGLLFPVSHHPHCSPFISPATTDPPSSLPPNPSNPPVHFSTLLFLNP